MDHTSLPARHDYDPQELLNSQPVIVTVIDPTSHLVQFQNETGINKFGDITAARCYEKIAAGESPCSFCKMQEAAESGAMTTNEVSLPHDQHIFVHWSRTVTASGEVHVIETITDITSHKRMERALREAQKMEALGRMAGGVAHDFNNLLMVINGCADNLLQELQAHPASRGLQLIKQAGTQASALTQKLLSFSRQQALEDKELCPNETLAAMEPLLRQLTGGHIELQLSCEPALGRTTIDPVHLEQVIMNLVVNARDAMSQLGRVSIQTYNTELDEAYVARHPGSRQGRYVALAVTDAGCGMDRETLAHIFEPFYSTKEFGKGTGLGLSIVYGIVKQRDGYIDVDSRVGEGSTFTVLLPRQFDANMAEMSASPVSHQGRTVVVVEDDDAVVRMLVVETVRARGYHVLEAGNGVEGLKTVRDCGDACCLVISDVLMPELNGPAMVEQLRDSRPNLKVLFMSGYSGTLLKQHGLTDTVQFLQKPIPPNLLAHRVDALLAATV
jgi:signal transduction histidine kinase/CheY-like chemotaxis protein